MSSWLDVALLAVLIVLNGVFAMSEISLVTSRRARLQRLIDDKVAGAERARELNADPNHHYNIPNYTSPSNHWTYFLLFLHNVHPHKAI